jgi:hypothetical protein
MRIKEETMKRQILFVILFSLICLARQVEAGCWCGIVYCIADITIDASKTRVSITYDILETADQSIGSCPYEGATPPSKICSVSGSYGSTNQWEVNGTLNFTYFGVSAKVGSEVTLSVSSGCSATIGSWCSCCHERVRAKYKNTYMEGLCWCLDPLFPLLCVHGSSYSGTNKEYQSIGCDDEPQCIVPPECSPNCPPPG